VQPVVGWRAFTVGEDGALISPFLQHFWPQADPGWPTAEQTARCLAADHPAPDADCTCGLRAVVSYPELLKALERPFAGGGGWAILKHTGAIARVELSGRIELGYDMPDDDPPTTKRGERARLLEVFLSPAHAGNVGAIEARYEVPARVEQSWPDAGAA
jgi:hypothetical protein